MPVTQLGQGSYFGRYAPSDPTTLERLAEERSGSNNQMFAASAESSQPDVGRGSASDFIKQGYYLLDEFATRRDKLVKNEEMYHPQIQEQKLGYLVSDALEIASIIGIKLFLKSTIMQDITFWQEQNMMELNRSEALLQEETFPNMQESYKTKLEDLAKSQRRFLQIKGMMYDPESVDNDGGILWQELMAAKEQLAEARGNAAMSVDQQALANEMMAVPSIVKRYNAISRLMEWYNTQATKLQKIALQKTGHMYIPAPLQQNPDDSRYRAYQSFMRQLERDADDMYSSDETELAQERIRAAADDCEAALKLIQRMKEIFARPVIGASSSGILSPRLGLDMDLLSYICSSVNRPNPEAWDLATYPWMWGKHSNMSLKDKLERREVRGLVDARFEATAAQPEAEEQSTEPVEEVNAE